MSDSIDYKPGLQRFWCMPGGIAIRNTASSILRL